MNYEVKNVILSGSPKRKDESTFIQTVTIVTGIVGQTYKGFENLDMLDVEFPATGKNATQIEALIQSKAAEFSSTKYPNT